MPGVIREITIKPMLNGFTVQVGCQTLVYTSIDALCADLKSYHKDPKAMEELMIGQAVNPTTQAYVGADWGAAGSLTFRTTNTINTGSDVRIGDIVPTGTIVGRPV